MIRLGVAPRLIDFSRGALQTIDQWFNQVTARFNVQRKAGATVLSEVPNNQWGIFKDTSSGELNLIVNDNGSLVETELGPLSSLGDVNGPASSTDGNVVLFDGVSGKLIKDSGLTLSGNNTGDQFTNVTASKLLGRGDSGAGAAQEITVGSGLAMTGTTLTATATAPATITFSATKTGAAQSVASATPTKITFQTEEFDVGDGFDLPNSRFQPTTAGYYFIVAHIEFAGSVTAFLIQLTKNGSAYKFGDRTGSAASAGRGGYATAIVYLNGTTDYVEVVVQHGTGAAVSVDNGGERTYFQGHLIAAM